MRVKFLWGMGACPHVSEAKLNPHGGAGAGTLSAAGALVASGWNVPRLERQTAVSQVQP